MNPLKNWIILSALTIGTFAASAATLNIGDPAPKLEVSKWVQGEPVTEFKPGTVYIVEFWATWCGPCRATIPHINEIYTKFKDKGLVVIGQDVREHDVEKVEPFIKEMGTNMTYRVALDSFPEGDKDKGNMAEHWMAASGSTGIPTAFIVNKEGKIAWIGHPVSINDQLINEIYDGKFDSVKAAEERKKEVTKQMYSIALKEAIKAKDWDKATTAVDGLENALGDEFKLRLAGTRVKILAGKGDIEGATKLATKVADENQKEVSVQIDIGRALADIEEVKAPQLELAAKLADRANELSEGKNFQALDLEARIAFLQGNKEKAVEWATKALDKVPEQGKKYFETRLNSYKEGKLPK